MGENGDEQGASRDDEVDIVRKQYTVKDKWDKWGVVLRPLGGIFTGVVIGALGFMGSNILESRQANEMNMRLYSELMTQREQAENKLKSEMFQKIFDSFLSPKDAKSTDKLEEIKEDLLQLELLARNFHESIDVKPIFRKILFSILEVRRPLIKTQRRLKEEDELNEENANKLRNVDRELNKLIGIAGRIARKQLEVLGQNRNVIEMEVPYSKLCMNARPNSAFKKQDCDNEETKGYKVNKKLTITAGKKDLSRDFEISVKYAYPKWNQVYLSVKAYPMNSDKVDDFDCSESKNINKINNICKEFWVSRFDYPLVDNTYLSKDERYGVAIDSIDTKREMIRLVLVYFPATYSGLKEKSFYHQKILNHLDDWELFGETK